MRTETGEREAVAAIAAIAERFGVRMEAQRVYEVPEEVIGGGEEMVSWLVTFRVPVGDGFTTYFHHGFGWTPARYEGRHIPEGLGGPYLPSWGYSLNDSGKARNRRAAYRKPQLEDVLPSLVLDAQTHEEYGGDLDAFFSDFGYEEPSRAMRAMEGVRAARAALLSMFGEEGYGELVDAVNEGGL